jgi:hypothetical protein
MNNDKEKVIEMLHSYRQKKRMIEQLKFELENPSQITAEEVLRAISIGNSEFTAVHSGGVSDKTMSVVAHYSDITSRLNLETLDQIKRELRMLVSETSKLELYVSLLDKNYENVIHLRDFEGKSWSEIETALNSTERRLRERRKAAIEELSNMYGFVDAFKEKNTEEG